MIQRESIVYAADNSGVKYAKCLKIYKYKNGIPGSLLTVSIQRSKIRKRRIRKSELYKAVLIQTRKERYRISGHYIKGINNYIVILKKRDPLPIANRIKKAVLAELRYNGFYKIMFLSPSLY
jgi:ribosomal protein L14